MAKLQRWDAPPKCSFCGKTPDRVAKMVAGSGVWICNECVDLCHDIIATDTNPPAPRRRWDDSRRDSDNGRAARKGTPSEDTVLSRSPRLVLASSSASRLRVLRDAGFDPVGRRQRRRRRVRGPHSHASRRRHRRAQGFAVADRCQDSLVIGCDSMLELDGEALGKPVSGAEVRRYGGDCRVDRPRSIPATA